MAAGDVDVRIVTDLTTSAIDSAVTASISATSNDAALSIIPGSGGESIIIVTVARS
tara:strand:- start:474 stop:641 length:168 start_codon:yes stop_codon:yes gene_type:complete